ncbi:hypothetical protein MM188_003226 [Vibrio cholerae]|nr:hypothetical protein [Vibrio cholerae]
MKVIEQVEIEGKGVARLVYVFNAQTLSLLASAASTPDGVLEVDVPDTTDSVLLVAQDEDGGSFIGGFRYQLGQRVKVAEIAEYRYEVYLAGVSGDAPTQWPQQDGELITSGGVTFRCVRYFRPIARFVSLTG